MKRPAVALIDEGRDWRRFARVALLAPKAAGTDTEPAAIEVGDVGLRAALTEVRRLIDGLSQHARAFVSTFGR